MKRIVFTGGPNGGKSTALKIMQETFGSKVAVVKEAATMLYGGGYPRNDSSNIHRYHGQRIIFFMTAELENLAARTAPEEAKVLICDRGSLDGAVYWPFGTEDFFKEMKVDRLEEMKKYDMVIHLSPPNDPAMYEKNSVRTETLEVAQQVDQGFIDIWDGHPNRVIIDKNCTYLEKIEQIEKIIKDIIESEK
ncbi:putative ATPase [Parelusimicrobium proximum]|uniref:ATP/GTP-binding protein n=1 Tax=Parelusimicrobium proximum TaxID=3228953 RepID=UPI003D17B665